MPDKKKATNMSELLARRVQFCDAAPFAVKGSKEERRCMDFLLKTLQPEVVGDYRLLINYNIMVKGRGNALEVDIVVISRMGIFLLEVKDWHGTIVALDAHWLANGKERPNPMRPLANKERVLHSQLFGKDGAFPALAEVSVSGLVVMAQGLSRFTLRGHDSRERIVAIGERLARAVSTTHILQRGTNSRQLSDAEIRAISEQMYTRHEASEQLVHGYRIIDHLVLRDSCDTFIAQHEMTPAQRVRLKRYTLPSLDQAELKLNMRVIQRSFEAMVALGSHSHLLTTLGFFNDDINHREDVFYELTELPNEPGLDAIMQTLASQGRRMSFAQQLAVVNAVSQGLRHAHNFKDEAGRSKPIYHRNICPETVFQMRGHTFKLGDFDFSKFSDRTISVPGQPLMQALKEKPYTAPELLRNTSDASPQSDIYALGVLWYFMASLPAEPEGFDPTTIDRLEISSQARALLKRMTAANSHERPTRIEEVLAALVVLQGP